MKGVQKGGEYGHRNENGRSDWYGLRARRSGFATSPGCRSGQIDWEKHRNRYFKNNHEPFVPAKSVKKD